jgi:CDP-glycerol glycerophosphotransferase (TagB/SpsB family)
MAKVLFYLAYPYYFPHFLPISKELQKRGFAVKYILSDKQNPKLMIEIARKNKLDYELGRDKLFNLEADFIFFSNNFPEAKQLKATTIFLEHGIGTKSTSFYQSIEYFDLYLVEGTYKYDRLRELYPQFEQKLKMVGFSKYDSLLSISTAEKLEFQQRFSLDPHKKTILYAPTFFPSSIEKMSLSFPEDFSDCNILIKAHYLSYERKSYQKQIKRLQHWSTYPNCRLAAVSEYDLTPFLANSDVMISDESSAMFEFAGLQKAVISNQYFKLRWSYYLMPWKLKKRIDQQKDRFRRLLHEAKSYAETKALTRNALKNSTHTAEMKSLIAEISGIVDGQVSARIADLLENEKDNHL